MTQLDYYECVEKYANLSVEHNRAMFLLERIAGWTQEKFDAQIEAEQFLLEMTDRRPLKQGELKLL